MSCGSGSNISIGDMSMIVIVTGSREHGQESMELIWNTLDDLPISLLVVGDARGADSIALAYCWQNGIPYCKHDAHWFVHGRAAGPIRNQSMLYHHPDALLCVAFPLSGSKGTWDMVNRAKKNGIHCLVVPTH